MLRPHDIRNPSVQSGYSFVRSASAGPNGGGKTELWKAEVNRDGKHWRGPYRRTPAEAAQDYCDFLNGNPSVPSSPMLVSAGHTGKRDKLPSDPEVQAALGVLRDARGERLGNQGYVYCIGEATGDAVLVGGRRHQTAVKIGFSTNPEARLPELQTGNPRRLVLLGKIEGTREDEAKMHAKYAHLNILQEWFRPTAALLSEFGMWADFSRRAAA